MKDYREKAMKNLMILYISIILIWATPILDYIKNEEYLDRFLAISNAIEAVIISAAISCLTILVDCIISSRCKNRLVGLFFMPLAGETIFSRIESEKVQDERFRCCDAKNFYKDIIAELPTVQKEKRNAENSQWYRIYQNYCTDGAVVQSQKDYLMCRDLYIETIVFLISYVIATLVTPSAVVLTHKLLAFFIIAGMLLNICTHSKMNRFVNTVIAIDMAKREKL